MVCVERKVKGCEWRGDEEKSEKRGCEWRGKVGRGG